jgi:hypothetical protein
MNKWSFLAPISEERKKAAEAKWEEFKKSAGKRPAEGGAHGGSEEKKARDE